MVFYKYSLEFDEDIKLAYNEKLTVSKNNTSDNQRKAISIENTINYNKLSFQTRFPTL